MSKLQDIRNLVQEHAVSVSSSPGDWMDYMDTASRLYRYSFSLDRSLWSGRKRDGELAGCVNGGCDYSGALPHRNIQRLQEK